MVWRVVSIYVDHITEVYSSFKYPWLILNFCIILISGLHNGLSLVMRSKSCRYAILNDPEVNNFSCIECNKLQQQINLLQNIPIGPEDSTVADPVDDQCCNMIETKELTGDECKENTSPEICDIQRNDFDIPFSIHRLRLLKGISVLQDKGNNVKNGKQLNHLM